MTDEGEWRYLQGTDTDMVRTPFPLICIAPASLPPAIMVLVWQGMPSKGVSLKSGQTIYLKCKMEGASPYFGGTTATVSEINLMDPSVKYDGPGAGDSILHIDLCKGTGRVHMNFD